MPWLWFTDDYIDDVAILGLSDAGFRAWHEAIAYSSQKLLDGHVPDAFFKRRNLTKGRKDCERVGLFTPEEGGVEVRNFLKYQRSREAVEADRSARQNSKKAGGQARAASAKRDGGGRFASTGTSSPPAGRQHEDQQTSSIPPAPLPSPPSPEEEEEREIRARSAPIPLYGPPDFEAAPEPNRGALSASEVELLAYLHSQVGEKLGLMPDTYWCEDLIRRGATRTDVDQAVQASLGKGLPYVRTCLMRRVALRERGEDPDAEPTPRERGGTRLERGYITPSADGVPRSAQTLQQRKAELVAAGTSPEEAIAIARSEAGLDVPSAGLGGRL